MGYSLKYKLIFSRMSMYLFEKGPVLSLEYAQQLLLLPLLP